VITELRTYLIKRGHMEAWLERWAEAAEKNEELGIRIEFAGFDPESMGTFIWARSFENEAERQRLSNLLYGSDWWREVGDEVMSHVTTYEVRLLQTTFQREDGRPAGA
jgi:hypothetical protein